MRKIEYPKNYHGLSSTENELIIKDVGLFHRFCTHYDVYDDSTPSYPVAIIETTEGQLKLIPVDLCKFIDVN